MIFYALFTHKIKKLKCNYWSIFFYTILSQSLWCQKKGTIQPLNHKNAHKHSGIERYMAKWPIANSKADLRGGVCALVWADRAAQLRRSDSQPACPERNVHQSNRTQLYPIRQTDHRFAFRTTNPREVRDTQIGTEHTTVEKQWYDRYFAVQNPNRHCKYKESVCNSGPQKDHYWPPAQSKLHFRLVYRGRMQPFGTLGRYGRSRRSGQHAIQSIIYIWRFGTRQNPYRTGDRTRNPSAPPANAGAICVDE